MMMSTWTKRGLKSCTAALLIAALLCGMIGVSAACAEDVATPTNLQETYVAAIYLDEAELTYIGDVTVYVRNEGDPYTSIDDMEELFLLKERTIDVSRYDYAYGATRQADKAQVIDYIKYIEDMPVLRLVGAPRDMNLFIILSPAAKVESEPVQIPSDQVEDEAGDEKPTEVVSPDAADEPVQEEEKEPVDEPEEADAGQPEEPDTQPEVELALRDVIAVECKIAGEPKTCYYFGDEVGFDAFIIMKDESVAVDSLALVYQWQVYENDAWVDLEGENFAAYRFTLSLDNYRNYYRVAVSLADGAKIERMTEDELGEV